MKVREILTPKAPFLPYIAHCEVLIIQYFPPSDSGIS